MIDVVLQYEAVYPDGPVWRWRGKLGRVSREYAETRLAQAQARVAKRFDAATVTVTQLGLPPIEQPMLPGMEGS